MRQLQQYKHRLLGARGSSSATSLRGRRDVLVGAPLEGGGGRAALAAAPERRGDERGAHAAYRVEWGRNRRGWRG